MKKEQDAKAKEQEEKERALQVEWDKIEADKKTEPEAKELKKNKVFKCKFPGCEKVCKSKAGRISHMRSHDK